jgi:hypothetical protein
MKITSTLTAVTVSTLLHCGVLAADPTTQKHGIEHHSELIPTLFCVAAYSLITQQASTEYGAWSIFTQDLRSRGLGLHEFLLKLTTSSGHSLSESQEELQWHIEYSSRMTDDEFHRKARAFDCKGMTQQWAWIKPAPEPSI